MLKSNRAMKHELRNPAFLCEGLDKGNVCPACPKVSFASIFVHVCWLDVVFVIIWLYTYFVLS